MERVDGGYNVPIGVQTCGCHGVFVAPKNFQFLQQAFIVTVVLEAAIVDGVLKVVIVVLEEME